MRRKRPVQVAGISVPHQTTETLLTIARNIAERRYRRGLGTKTLALVAEKALEALEQNGEVLVSGEVLQLGTELLSLDPDQMYRVINSNPHTLELAAHNRKAQK